MMVKQRERKPDIYECFDCNGRMGSFDRIVVCPFCRSEEIDVVV